MGGFDWWCKKIPGWKKNCLCLSWRLSHCVSADSAVLLISTLTEVRDLDAHFSLHKTWLLSGCWSPAALQTRGLCLGCHNLRKCIVSVSQCETCLRVRSRLREEGWKRTSVCSSVKHSWDPAQWLCSISLIQKPASSACVYLRSTLIRNKRGAQKSPTSTYPPHNVKFVKMTLHGDKDT